MVIEPYRDEHRGACLKLFDSNAPRFFRAEEREEFESFLSAPPGPYLIGWIGQEVVAAGGFAEDPGRPGTWLLCWGMVAASLHRQGLGREMLQARLEALSQRPGFREARINTSQHSSAFFERFGFVVAEVELDGFGPGLHRYAMRRGQSSGNDDA